MGQARLVGTEMASLKADLSLARGYGMGFKPQKDMTWECQRTGPIDKLTH